MDLKDMPLPPSNEVSSDEETEVLDNINLKVIDTSENKPAPKELQPIVPNLEDQTPIAGLSFSSSKGGGCSTNNPRMLFTAIISVIMILCGVVLLSVPGVSDKGTNVGIIMISMTVGLWGGGMLEPLNVKPNH